jgi:phospholipase/carboxylesterase
MEAVGAAAAALADAGWPAERLLLVGFSQGACVVLEYVARNPRRYGGVAALTGGLIGADGEVTRPRGLAGTPVLNTSAEGDEWVPPERTRESAEILAAGGADVDLRVFDRGSHAIRAQEVDAVAALARAASAHDSSGRP